MAWKGTDELFFQVRAHRVDIGLDLHQLRRVSAGIGPEPRNKGRGTGHGPVCLQRQHILEIVIPGKDLRKQPGPGRFFSGLSSFAIPAHTPANGATIR